MIELIEAVTKNNICEIERLVDNDRVINVISNKYRRIEQLIDIRLGKQKLN